MEEIARIGKLRHTQSPNYPNISLKRALFYMHKIYKMHGYDQFTEFAIPIMQGLSSDQMPLHSLVAALRYYNLLMIKKQNNACTMSVSPKYIDQNPNDFTSADINLIKSWMLASNQMQLYYIFWNLYPPAKNVAVKHLIDNGYNATRGALRFYNVYCDNIDWLRQLQNQNHFNEGKKMVLQLQNKSKVKEIFDAIREQLNKDELDFLLKKLNLLKELDEGF